GATWPACLCTPLTNRPQTPYDIAKVRARSQDWRDTEARMPAAEAYLKTSVPFPLEKAPGGKESVIPESWKDAKDPARQARYRALRQGKLVFADNCARCHSNKQPDGKIADPARLKQFYRDSV